MQRLNEMALEAFSEPGAKADGSAHSCGGRRETRNAWTDSPDYARFLRGTTPQQMNSNAFRRAASEQRGPT